MSDLRRAITDGIENYFDSVYNCRYNDDQGYEGTMIVADLVDSILEHVAQDILHDLREREAQEETKFQETGC